MSCQLISIRIVQVLLLKGKNLKVATYVIRKFASFFMCLGGAEITDASYLSGDTGSERIEAIQ